jgi:ubiquinol-cytochrome c reductase cytochrome b subunit
VSRLGKAVVQRVANGLDERFHLAGSVRKETSHVFPKHHSFFWGEFALYSFIVLLVSGTWLALFFVPDTADTVYHGAYVPAQNVHMSRAYESALNISFDIRAGLFIRQIHHWAALLFVSSMVLHMYRNFFTGAFRKPRELTWVGGVALLLLSILEGFIGYSMVDDLLSGLGVRIFSGILLSVPVIGTWLHWMVFGGEYDGHIWISRFFVGHVFLLPGLLFALVAVHVGLVWYLKHTQFPGPGARETNVVGERTLPGFGSKTVGNGLGVVAVVTLLAGLCQINPVFLWGQYDASASSSGVQPDWYAGFLIGGLRLFPRWDIHLGRYTVPAPFWPGLVLPLVMFTLLAVYPFLERWWTRDRRPHQLLERPRDNAGRTGVGAMAIAFYAVLLGSGAIDVVAVGFNIPFERLVWAGRVALFVLPPVTYCVTVRICRGLQRHDRDILRHGLHTGILKAHGDGVFLELRQPPGGVDHAGRPIPLTYTGARIPPEVATTAVTAEHPRPGQGPDEDRPARP